MLFHDLLLKHVPDFIRFTSIRQLKNGVFVIECSDEAGLASVLHDFHHSLQTGPNINTVAFQEALLRANLSMSQVLAVPDKKRDGTRSQQANVELGDLGESLAAFSLVGYRGYDVRNIHPKNILKINPRYSERGIDLLMVDLSDTVPSEEGLCTEDRLHLYESKASGGTGETFRNLLADAASTRNCVTQDRLWGELIIVQERIAELDGHDRRARRLKWFFIEYANKTNRVESHAHLAATQLVDEKVETSILNSIEKQYFNGVIMFRGRVEKIREQVFAYRRNSNV